MLLEDTRGYLKSFVDTEAERMPVNLWCWFPENSGVSICNEEAKGSSPTVAWTPPLISRWTYYGRSRSPSTRCVDNHSSSDIPSDGGWFPPWLIFFSWAFQGAVFAKQSFWRRSWRPGRLECTVIYLPRPNCWKRTYLHFHFLQQGHNTFQSKKQDLQETIRNFLTTLENSHGGTFYNNNA